MEDRTAPRSGQNPPSEQSSSTRASSRSSSQSAMPDEKRPLIQKPDCRICGEEDVDVPCACGGTSTLYSTSYTAHARTYLGETVVDIRGSNPGALAIIHERVSIADEDWGALIRFVVVFLMAFLTLAYWIYMTNTKTRDGDPPSIYDVMVKAARFAVPCCIMALIVNNIKQRRDTMIQRLARRF